MELSKWECYTNSRTKTLGPDSTLPPGYLHHLEWCPTVCLNVHTFISTLSDVVPPFLETLWGQILLYVGELDRSHFSWRLSLCRCLRYAHPHCQTADRAGALSAESRVPGKAKDKRPSAEEHVRSQGCWTKGKQARIGIWAVATFQCSLDLTNGSCEMLY